MTSLLNQHNRRRCRRGTLLALRAALLAGSLATGPALFAAGEGDLSHSGHASPVAMPGWTQALKGQTVVEDAIEGRAGRSEKVELQHHRLMRKLEEQAQKDAQAQTTSGVFNGMSMMHQYMGQDGSSFLLMSDPAKGEPVSMSGGKCPAGVPTKQYDVSMINVEVTLNRWLDFYPGYMYVLTENIDKVRAEEAKNKAAREKEFDPGAVTTGLQGDIIQPLVLRANQGDCVKLMLRNQMEGEDGSLFIQASSMIVSARTWPIPGTVLRNRNSSRSFTLSSTVFSRISTCSSAEFIRARLALTASVKSGLGKSSSTCRESRVLIRLPLSDDPVLRAIRF